VRFTKIASSLLLENNPAWLLSLSNLSIEM